MPVNYQNVNTLIQAALKDGMIRLESSLLNSKGLPKMCNSEYRNLLQESARTLEELRKAITIRVMSHDYADLCSFTLEKQSEVYNDFERKLALQSKKKENERVDDTHNPSQLEGMKALQKARKQLPETQALNNLHNPNIIVKCDSGTTGELGCIAGHVKVYQAVYSASYGNGGYKDVFIKDKKIEIYPAKGGKCNVSIGNPFRIVGWYMNYVNQGSNSAVVRCWEIPQKYFMKLLEHCGTEWEVKQAKQNKKDKEVYVELCDHKAPNQFGLWTHDKKDPPQSTSFGEEFMRHSKKLITYYDPTGSHKYDNKRDGIGRDIGKLFDHLAIPRKGRFHDLGTALTDAKGNLKMNQKKRAEDTRLLAVIELLSMSTVEFEKEVKTIDTKSIRMFANVLSYNNLNPQKLNKSKVYTPTGLVIKHLKRESKFMSNVYLSSDWHAQVRAAVTDMVFPNEDLPKDLLEEMPEDFDGVKTYEDARKKLIRLLGVSSTTGGKKEFDAHSEGWRLYANIQIIDGLNRILRPICRLGKQKFGDLDRVSTKNENYKFGPLKDKRFQVGAGQRVLSSPLGYKVDSLGGYKGGGFTRPDTYAARWAFKTISEKTFTSNTKVQLMLHDEVIETLNDAEIPVMGGISGTTRDIFQYFSTFHEKRFWHMFAVVAAFMIKFHYHSLSECFIAADQYYRRNPQHNSSPRSACTQLSPDSIYKYVASKTGMRF